MRTLTESEIGSVSGGLDFETGGMAVLSLSVYSPLTAVFGVPIGLAMLYVGHRRNAGT